MKYALPILLIISCSTPTGLTRRDRIKAETSLINAEMHMTVAKLADSLRRASLADGDIETAKYFDSCYKARIALMDAEKSKAVKIVNKYKGL